jgi:hypothetical protein
MVLRFPTFAAFDGKRVVVLASSIMLIVSTHFLSYRFLLVVVQPTGLDLLRSFSGPRWRSNQTSRRLLVRGASSPVLLFTLHPVPRPLSLSPL